MMGDVLDAAENEPVQASANWAKCPEGARLALIVDGVTQETLAVQPSGSRAWQLLGARAHWCLVTLRDERGQMLALTNPIFLDGRK
jgi:hypothetical protein